MRDAYDPQFLQNLSRLGQVKVPKNATNYQPVSLPLSPPHTLLDIAWGSLTFICTLGYVTRCWVIGR